MSHGAFSHTLFNPILNTPQDIPHVVFDVLIVKSQGAQAKFLHILLSSLITFILIAMAVAINLDYQVQLRAMEIHDVFVNGPLSQEGGAFSAVSIGSIATPRRACC